MLEAVFQIQEVLAHTSEVFIEELKARDSFRIGPRVSLDTRLLMVGRRLKEFSGQQMPNFSGCRPTVFIASSKGNSES